MISSPSRARGDSALARGVWTPHQARLHPSGFGKQIADDGHFVLALLAVAYACMAINVVPHYALLAFGRARLIAALNIGSGLVLMILIAALVPSFGLVGAGLGRIAYSMLLAVPYLIASRKAFKARVQFLPLGMS